MGKGGVFCGEVVDEFADFGGGLEGLGAVDGPFVFGAVHLRRWYCRMVVGIEWRWVWLMGALLYDVADCDKLCPMPIFNDKSHKSHNDMFADNHWKLREAGVAYSLVHFLAVY